MHLISADKLKQKWHKAINVAVALVLAVMLFPLFQPASPIAHAHPAAPAILTHEVTLVAAGTTCTITTPSGVQADDLLILVCTTDGTGAALSGPSGWTVLLAENQSGGQTTASWYKISNGSEDPNYSVTWTGNEDAVGSITRISGVDTSDPIKETNTGTGTGNVVAPAVTTTVDDCLVFRFHGLDDDDQGDNYCGDIDAQHTCLYARGTATNRAECSGSVGYKTQASAGDTGTCTWSIGRTEGWYAATVAIAPLAGPTTKQLHFRWRDDTTDLNISGGWYAVEDSNSIGSLQKNTTIRLRIEVANTGADAESGARTYELQYEHDSTWTGIGDASDAFDMVDTTHIEPDGESATPGLLANSEAYTFVTGEGRDILDTTGSIGPLSASYYTELEYSFQATASATGGDTYRFRLYDTTAASPLDNYAVYPEVTIATPTTEQLHFRWRDDTTLLNTSGGWHAVEDSNSIGTLQKNTTIRLRIEVANTGGAAELAARTYEFQWSEKSTTCADCVTWTGIGDASDAFDMVDTTHIEPDGESATPGLLANSEAYTFVTGEGRDILDTTGSIGPLSASYYTELEYSFQATASATGGSTYCFRLYDTTAGAPLDDYAVYPEVTIYQAANVDQTHYRWRNDSYGLNTNNGWYAAEDTAISSVQKQTTVRVRVEIANTGGASADNYQYRIEYATDTGGPWTAVPVTATTEPFEMVDSGQYADGDDITSGFLTATGTWANGKGVEDPSNQTANYSLTNAYYTEFEYAIQATTNATDGGTYYFRLTNAGSPLDNYAVYPQVTIYVYVPVVTYTPIFESFLTGTAGGTYVYIGKPEGTVDGDLLIAIMATDGAGETLTAPAGWTPITGNIGTNHTSRSWYKIASSEPTTYEFTLGSSEDIVIGILRFSDHNSSTPINISGTNTGSGTSATCPTVTTTTDRCLILRYFGADHNPITPDRGYPSAHTGIYVLSSAWRSGSFSSSGTAYTTQTSAGATGTAAFSLRTSEEWSAVTIAIAPKASTNIDVNVDTIGTQEPVVSLPSSDQHVGGAFTIVDNTGSRNVTGITITEYGTVNAQNNLANVELWYDLDNTAPYDGASVSYSGDETQFDSATTFNGADGTASFSGSVGISTTATMVVYVVLDVGSGASGGENLEIKITDPSTEVTVSTGNVTPSTAKEISGTTVLSVGVSQAHYLWRNDDGGEGQAWYNTDWGYRKTIAFTSDPTKIPSTQSNFPVLVDVTDTDLRTTGNGGHVEHASGWDIVFTDSDGITLLDHEITEYTSSAGTYTAWVKIPSLSMGKVIYMYYGKTGVGSDPSATDTWDTNFKMVQHLNETSGTHEDSTTNNNDGTAQEGVTQDATGKINGGDEFDGIDNYIDCGTGASLNITTEITLEAWGKKATAVKKDVAEVEPMEAVLVQYPFGIPMDLIADMSQDVKIVTIVTGASQQSTVESQYSTAGVNCAGGNCIYIHHPTDNYWTRDSGPMFCYDENDELRIADHTYNRERPDDNDEPQMYGTDQGIPVEFIALIHSGGNWMSDGHGKAVTTTLIETENPNLTEAEIDAEALDHLGITTWDKRPNAGGASINHIDCWAKLLAPDKIMIGNWNSALNSEATYFSTTAITPYGGNYTVYRCPAGPYINALIMNDHVYLPFEGVAADATAQTAFENAMPGYTVTGYTDSWGDDDALHCRTHELPSKTPWVFDYIVSKGQDAYELQMNRIGSTLNGYTSTNQITTSTSSQTDWHHYALTFDGTDRKLYIDGELQNTAGPSGTIASNSTEVTIGGAKPDASDNFWGTLTDGGYFSGTLDEVRISATPRTADWVKTSYHNQNDPSTFHSVGSEEASAVGASRKAAEDTAVTGQARVKNVRLRFLIKNTGGTASDYNYRLQVSETGPTSGFSDVPTNTAGPGCAVAATVTSTNFTNQDPTTRQLSVSHCDTWTAGKMVEDPSNQSDVITLDNLRFTEVEFNLKFTSNAAGETIYWFRVVNGATPLDNYSQVAQITITTVPAWDSYEGNYGDSGGTQCDEFFDYATEHEVYMYGTGFSTGNYKVIYWDEAGSKAMIDSSITVTGDFKLKSTCVFDPPMATEGNWHVTVYFPDTHSPENYSTVDSNIVADDTSYTTACGYAFYVDQGAIPEFPTVIAAISVAGLCFGIYYWMRKRRLAHVKA